MRVRAVVTLLLAATITEAAGAQSLASRITSVGNGTVRFHFAAREGVCGNGRGNISIRRDGDRRSTISTGSTRRTRDREWEDECEPGPVRVALDVESRRIVDLRSYVGGGWRGSADRDLGEVPAAEASAFLMDLAESASAEVAEDAIPPAILANTPSPWRRLLAIAKDEDRPRSARQSATFWVAQAAEEAATAGLAEIVDSDGNRELRKHAVFALSQRPKDESVPALIRVARTNRDPEIRRTAIFWLGQSRDPRALEYIEQVLLGSR